MRIHVSKPPKSSHPIVKATGDARIRDPEGADSYPLAVEKFLRGERVRAIDGVLVLFRAEQVVILAGKQGGSKPRFEPGLARSVFWPGVSARLSRGCSLDQPLFVLFT